METTVDFDANSLAFCSCIFPSMAANNLVSFANSFRAASVPLISEFNFANSSEFALISCVSATAPSPPPPNAACPGFKPSFCLAASRFCSRVSNLLNRVFGSNTSPASAVPPCTPPFARISSLFWRSAVALLNALGVLPNALSILSLMDSCLSSTPSSLSNRNLFIFCCTRATSNSEFLNELRALKAAESC